MIKNISKYCMVGAVVLGMGACTNDFNEINQNPNATSDPVSLALLTNAINSIPGTVTATQGQLYVQYLTNAQYTSADNYQTVQFDYGGWYSGPMMDLQTIVRLNTEEATKEAALAYGSNENQIAVAQILQSYFFQHVSDRWGDIPYGESLSILEGIRQPTFDTQESVYTSIIQVLKQANATITDTDPVVGDIMFGGDMESWRMFANTIRMNMALRMSEANPALAEAEFNSAITDGVFTSNVSYAHLAVEDFDNPWEDRFFTRRDYAMALPLVSRMQTVANGGELDVAMDPRLPVYADPTDAGIGYVGKPYGLTEAEAGTIPNEEVSFLGIGMREQTTPTYIYSHAQILFAQAEAAYRGWGGDAETLYNDAIEASLTQYGVEAELATFMSNSAVAYDGTLEQIMTQKWVANFLNGYEAWADWRRTDFPSLDPSPNALTPNGGIPVRQAYPVFEATLNADNYDAVVARQGADDLETHIWWDK